MADIPDGATVLIGGFGSAGHPVALIEALLEGGATDLTVVSNNAGNGDHGLAALIRQRRVRKMVCSFPRQPDSWHFDTAWRAGQAELELVPQGNLAERIRVAGAGIGAFYTPTGFGTPLAEAKETRVIDGRGYLLEYPLPGDVALIAAHTADQQGNLVYHKSARNFGPIMAAAARLRSFGPRATFLADTPIRPDRGYDLAHQLLGVIADDHRDQQGDRGVEPVPAAGAEDDSAADGHPGGGRGVRSRIEQDRLHVQVFLAVVAAGVAAEDERAGQHDGRRDAADDQHRQALDPAGAFGEALDRRRGDRDVQHEQPPALTSAARLVALG